METSHATVAFDTHRHAGPIDRRIFGGFLEHMGRAVYEGVYDPGNALSDEHGFRRDVLDALRAMQMPLVRYPGGNFVSSYDWRDGIGPPASRPVRPDFAWKSIETNRFGTDEFMAWCNALGAAPMLAVNLGTAGAAEAAALLEYCNLPPGTYWADRRKANGHAAPYAVELWCMGNEMDGPWQAGQVPAEVYGQRAGQAAKLMKGLDPTIQTVACGSSARGMPTYMEWDRIVLESCWDHVDYISAHRYSANRLNDTPWFLAEGVEIDRILEDYAALLGYVRALKKSAKRIHLSFDEWNVWYKNMEMNGHWKPAPHLIEESYNLEDALVCAQYLSSFTRRADLVKMACIAQLANVIAPILTRPEGILKQTIYYPFVLYARHARGTSLTPIVSSPTYRAGDRGEVAVLDAAAAFDQSSQTAAVFLVNRSIERELSVDIAFADQTVHELLGVDLIAGTDVKAANTWEHPDTVKPVAGKSLLNGTNLRITIPAPALAVVRARLAAK